MRTIHVGDQLAREWKIFRHMSFHDLADLLAFGQLGFTEVHPSWRDGLPGGLQAMRPQGHACVPGGEQADLLALQSWSLLPADGVADWHEPDMSRPNVCVVSSIGALVDALLAADAGIHVARVDGQAQSLLHVMVRVPRAGGMAVAGNRLRLSVDLGTLLEGVVVSSGASGRFVDLVGKLVQANTPAPISRARHARGAARGRTGRHAAASAMVPGDLLGMAAGTRGHGFA